MDEGEVLADLRKALVARGIAASGPHPGGCFSGGDYLLIDGPRAYAQLDRYGYWQILVYLDGRLVRMADPDGGDWPGDPV